MQAPCYLGALPNIGHTLWYIVRFRDQWLALLSFSAPSAGRPIAEQLAAYEFVAPLEPVHQPVPGLYP